MMLTTLVLTGTILAQMVVPADPDLDATLRHLEAADAAFGRAQGLMERKASLRPELYDAMDEARRAAQDTRKDVQRLPIQSGVNLLNVLLGLLGISGVGAGAIVAARRSSKTIGALAEAAARGRVPQAAPQGAPPPAGPGYSVRRSDADLAVPGDGDGRSSSQRLRGVTP